MLERWYPWAWASSVFAIDYGKLQARGYKGILFDIDNTLVHHGADASPEVEELFRQLRTMGLKTLLLSDNSAERIERFNRNIGVPYIAEAGKPDPVLPRRASPIRQLTAAGLRCWGCRWRKSSALEIRCSGTSEEQTAAEWPVSWWISSACRGRTHYGKKRVLEKWIMVCWRKSPRWRNRLGNIQK